MTRYNAPIIDLTRDDLPERTSLEYAAPNLRHSRLDLWQVARIGANEFRKIAAASGHTWAEIADMAEVSPLDPDPAFHGHPFGEADCTICHP